MITLPGVQHGYLEVNGIRMHHVSAGSGPLVLLLHGFPEFWYSWRHQIPALAEHFTVVAPDLRGYNETEKPAWGYEVDVLVNDIVALIERLGERKAIIVGHDWGGALAWMLAIEYPQRVERLINLNIPHPTLLLRALRNNPRQMLRSWYVGAFQLPFIPEAILSANDYALFEQALRSMATRPDVFSEADIQAYKDAVSRPGALTAMINYYRGLNRGGLSSFGPAEQRVTVPTLLIWGEKDRALGVELTHGTEQLVDDLQVRYIPDAGHWVQQERPELVNQYILEFLGV